MNIYVGNLSFSATEEELRELFSSYGQVDSVSIIMDRATGRSRGFAFVEMADDAEGQEAIEQINGKEWGDRALKVNQARPRANDGGGRRRDADRQTYS
ncbi:MAG: RNA-binding protein [Sedimentisphaerales bacterium]|nr:RNA-binding protein [Sedimentisphaerales bacterium]